MELLLDPAPGKEKAISFWKNPSAWIREKNLSRGYWIFFSAAFFFDAGFSVYVFLFNLFLLDNHFNERAMGWIGGAMTLGSVIGTLPAGALARRIGLRPLLVVLFITAPILGATRALWIWQPAQITLAFLAGLAMSSWGVCFLPAIARLTTEKNRTSAFSLIFSASIGTSILGGIVCGYLRSWLESLGITTQPVEVKRLILLASCALVTLGLIPVFRLRMPPLLEEDSAQEQAPGKNNVPTPSSRLHDWLRKQSLSPFLMRFLPAMALWCAILAAFTPFANVYLARDLHIPIEQIGLIFSTVQIVQFAMGIATPFVFRVLGLVRGIVATQIAAAVVLALLAGARNGKVAIALYLIFSAAQWMSSPGLYNLLMNETPDKERSTAAAMTLFCNALAGSAATAAAGVLFTRFGYPPVLLGIAIAAVATALLFLLLISPLQHRPPKIDPEAA
jgi:MFS family permease